MAIEKKIGIFYELLIRGSVGSAHEPVGLPLGSFAGAHYIEGTAIVDDGVVEKFTPGDPQVLPRDKIVAFLGEKFATFEEGHRQMVASLEAKHQRDVEALAADYGSTVAALTAERDAAVRRGDDLERQATELAAKLDSIKSTLAA